MLRGHDIVIFSGAVSFKLQNKILVDSRGTRLRTFQFFWIWFRWSVFVVWSISNLIKGFQSWIFQKFKINATSSRLKYHVIKKMHLKILAIISFTKNPYALENVKCIHKIAQILNHKRSSFGPVRKFDEVVTWRRRNNGFDLNPKNGVWKALDCYSGLD